MSHLRPGWYIVAYDIADKKRLQKIHRMLKKEGMAVQKSVFFVHGDEKSLNGLLGKLETVMNPGKDDIRAYPVTHPGEVWTTGGPLQQYPLVSYGRKKPPEKPKKQPAAKKPWWKKIF